jgi:hypothetical protein
MCRSLGRRACRVATGRRVVGPAALAGSTSTDETRELRIRGRRRDLQERTPAGARGRVVEGSAPAGQAIGRAAGEAPALIRSRCEEFRGDIGVTGAAWPGGARGGA